MNKKATEWSGLLKVPDSVLLQNALIEIGTLKSYIQELENKLNIKENIIKNSPEALLESNRALKINNKRLTEENKKMRDRIIKINLEGNNLILE